MNVYDWLVAVKLQKYAESGDETFSLPLSVPPVSPYSKQVNI